MNLDLDLERYRFATERLYGVATIAILCATCHEADEKAKPVIVFDFQYPSLGDAQQAIDAHEAGNHPQQ